MKPGILGFVRGVYLSKRFIVGHAGWCHYGEIRQGEAIMRRRHTSGNAHLFVK